MNNSKNLKIIFNIFSIICMLAFVTACDNKDITNNENVVINNKENEDKKYLLKEVVGTDKIEVILEKAEFALAANPAINKLYLDPIDRGGTFAVYEAEEGKSFVTMSYSVSNIDSASSINFYGLPNGKITYEGNTYILKGHVWSNEDPSEDAWDLNPCGIVDEANDTVIHNTEKHLVLRAGETVSIKIFGILDFEPNSLNDGFEFSFELPNSKNKEEKFTYVIKESS